jgi:hypothetical protein
MEDVSLYFTAQTGDDVTQSASGENFTQSIPLGIARNIAVGSKKLYLEAIVKEALVGAGDTVDIDLFTSSDSAGTQNVTVISQAIVSFPAASAAGSRLFAAVPEQIYNSTSFLEENLYLCAMAYARGSGAPSQGLVTCLLTLEPGIPHIYPTNTLV